MTRVARLRKVVLPPPVTKCRACGERLDRPHPCGTHLPDCPYDLRERAARILQRLGGQA